MKTKRPFNDRQEGSDDQSTASLPCVSENDTSNSVDRVTTSIPKLDTISQSLTEESSHVDSAQVGQVGGDIPPWAHPRPVEASRREPTPINAKPLMLGPSELKYLRSIEKEVMVSNPDYSVVMLRALARKGVVDVIERDFDEKGRETLVVWINQTGREYLKSLGGAS